MNNEIKTQNNQVTLQAYNQEIQPKIRTLFKKQDILKEWAADDETIAKYKEQIKEIQEEMKTYIKDTESELVREIDDLTVDIKLAIKGASKGSNYKPAQLRAYMFARAKEKIDDVLEKAELFDKLNNELI